MVFITCINKIYDKIEKIDNYSKEGRELWNREKIIGQIENN